MKNKMLEKEVEKKVKEYAEKRGMLSYKFVSPANRSVPDRVFIHSGRVFFIEFKRPGGVATVAQTYVITKMRYKGATVHVIDTIEKGKALIDEIAEDREFYRLVEVIWNDEAITRQAQYTCLASMLRLAQIAGDKVRYNDLDFLISLLIGKPNEKE